MKLVYTDMSQDMTKLLVAEAQAFVAEGKRIFYIAPNSLSFEKERRVLSLLENQASFDILVTRFAQLSRYFLINDREEKEGLDELGMTLLFYRVLSQFEEDELRVYGKLKQDTEFIQQLMALYQDMQTANVSISDLEAIESEDKRADLQKIFSALAKALQEENWQSQTKIAQFTQIVQAGKCDEELRNVVLVVDGFTRFTAEEEALIAALHSRVSEIVIGTYASQKAYQSTYIEGNLYQASVDFLRQLAHTYATKPVYLEGQQVQTPFSTIAKQIESRYDFTGEKLALTESEKKAVTIWEATNQKEEVEQVARSIRKHLQAGGRYQDILVLLGDVDSYQLTVRQVFDKYEIPFYLGQAEEMSHHPLVHLVESLERIKRYNFRTEDVINLFKSGLYGSFKQEAIDRLEQYLLFADVKGKKAFTTDFTANHQGKYDLEFLNQMRQSLLEPMMAFFQVKSQSMTGLLAAFTQFLSDSHLPENMRQLAQEKSEWEVEKEEQVWSSFTALLGQLHRLFTKEKVTVDEFLALLRAGMLGSHYRLVPATVDVVMVKSYDLIAPHTNKWVYAIGMTQSNFPKIAKNTSLLTENERAAINEATADTSRFDLVTKENTKKNHFTFASLLQSATKGLVLSAPQLLNENESTTSPYMKQLLDLDLQTKVVGRNRHLQKEDVAHYKGLLSRVIEANRLDFDETMSKEEETFWSVAIRYLRKKLEKANIVIPMISADLKTKILAQDTLDVLYPADQPLQLSASSLTDFYKNEYLYFLRHVLHLEEEASIHPDARSHGNFLHRIFERVMTDDEGDFDDKLSRAIRETRQEKTFASVYQYDSSSQFSEEVLLDIAKTTAWILRDDSVISVLADEEVFGDKDSNLLLLENGRQVNIRGKIDRLDSLKSDGALGVVDYKSSANSFKIDRFYNGLSPQLMTYIAAIHKHPAFSQTEKIFGAMYLHMLDPIVKLSDVKTRDDVLAEAYKSLVYKGLFLEEESNRLSQKYAKTKASLFSQEELEILLAHHEELYQQAAKGILSGHFAINPYTEDGRSVAGEQLKAITHFEANLHLGQARHLIKGGKKEDWLDRMKKGGQA